MSRACPLNYVGLPTCDFRESFDAIGSGDTPACCRCGFTAAAVEMIGGLSLCPPSMTGALSFPAVEEGALSIALPRDLERLAMLIAANSSWSRRPTATPIPSGGRPRKA